MVSHLSPQTLRKSSYPPPPVVIAPCLDDRAFFPLWKAMKGFSILNLWNVT